MQRTFATALLLVSLLVTQRLGLAQVRTEDPFPHALPASQGLSPEALARLSAVVQGFVDEEAVVGAELLVIKNRRTVLHEVYGWKDREARVPMQRNTRFNIRSMTKPVVGTAAQILIDEGRLTLDAPAAQYMPVLEGTAAGRATVADLLTHRSGLPYSLLLQEAQAVTRVDSLLARYDDLGDLAALAGERRLDFPPGTDFQYSDAGADLLGAIVARVAGRPLDEVVRTRVLDPLGMARTLTSLRPDSSLDDVASAYVGERGAWVRYWRPGDPPLYPFMLGSQGLYATPVDYARFLALWMDGGRRSDGRLLSPAAVERGTAPVSALASPTGFDGVDVRYGQMWMLYVPRSGSELHPPLAFGHTGSDGTAAWAWPELDLMVLYFTQSRGTVTTVTLERALQQLLLRPDSDVLDATARAALAPYAGTYVAQYRNRTPEEYAIHVEGDGLALRTPQGLSIALDPPDEEGRWRFAHAPARGVLFDLDDTGTATGLWLIDPVEMVRLTDGAPSEGAPYAGRYTLRGLGTAAGVFAVVPHEDGLAFVPPSGSVLPLRPPDGDRRWRLAGTEREHLTFREDATGFTLYQYHYCRRGAVPPEPTLTASDVAPYLGVYHDPEADVEIEVAFDGRQLVVISPSVAAPLALHPPDHEGRWYLRANPSIALRFNADEGGRIVSYTALTPAGAFERPRVGPPHPAQ